MKTGSPKRPLTAPTAVDAGSDSIAVEEARCRQLSEIDRAEAWRIAESDRAEALAQLYC